MSQKDVLLRKTNIKEKSIKKICNEKFQLKYYNGVKDFTVCLTNIGESGFHLESRW